MQPRPQGLLGIFQNGGSCGATSHFEKYPEGPGDEVVLHVLKHYTSFDVDSRVDRNPLSSWGNSIYVLVFWFFVHVIAPNKLPQDI